MRSYLRCGVGRERCEEGCPMGIGLALMVFRQDMREQGQYMFAHDTNRGY